MYLRRFNSDTAPLGRPQRFTFPFYYDPHPLALMAAQELQHYLAGQTDWSHNFGLDTGNDDMIIGKMFGVLVVEDREGMLGYLAAFSGKLGGSNHQAFFVPPVFDMLTEGSFYLEGEAELNALTREIERLENSEECKAAVIELETLSQNAARELSALKESIKANKEARRIKRLECPAERIAELEEVLRKESMREQLTLKSRQRFWKDEIATADCRMEAVREKIGKLKAERRQRSAGLQQRLFENYSFVNRYGEKKSLLDIFSTGLGVLPPSGAGECAAPKLLQYAFLNDLKPVALAEFWWGQSPPAEVRVHGRFYPACRQKCAPILSHMLCGIVTDPNPMEKHPDRSLVIGVLYEDDSVAVINKPAELLSVPGKLVESSLYTQALARFPQATGPLMVHRLDMSTSGLMVIALNIDAYRHLQKQFLWKTVRKSYVAVLEKDILGHFARKGVIDLPLRVDLEDRPRQVVCYEYGRQAITEYEILDVENGFTRIRFFPLTGRTHQLRMHAAHHLGLNAPIVGDDLYGTKSDRLHLHAEQLTFRHPVSRELMSFEAKVPF